MTLQPPAIRDERVVVRFDKAFVERVNAVANRLFEGNRSVLVRTVVREFVERNERDEAAESERAA